MAVLKKEPGFGIRDFVELVLLDQEEEKVPERVLPGGPNVLGSVDETFDLGRVQIVVRRRPDRDAGVEQRGWRRRRRFGQHRHFFDVIRFFFCPDFFLVGEVLPLLAETSFGVAVARYLRKMSK